MNGQEAVFVWGPIPGKDGGFPVEIFPLRVDFPPFADASIVTVRGTDDCLNIREAPSATTGSLGCYSDGTLGRITLAPDPFYNPQTDKDLRGPQPIGGVLHPDDLGTWLHVQIDNGPSGWMDTRNLGWP